MRYKNGMVKRNAKHLFPQVISILQKDIKKVHFFSKNRLQMAKTMVEYTILDN